MSFKVIRYLRLKMLAALGPPVEKFVQLLDVDEQVVGPASLRPAAGKRAYRLDQVGGVVVGAAVVATVAVLVGRLALGAAAFDEPIGQEGARRGVVELGHLLFLDQSGLAERGPNLLANFPRFLAVGAAIVVELDLEAGEVGLVGLLHLGDQLFLGDALLPSADHDGRAVGVVGTDVDAPPPAEFLETDPDVRLQVLDQVADVDMAVGIRQGTGDQESPHVHAPGSGR